MDRIVYMVISNGGGIDGRDHTDKGGKVMLATFDKADAEGYILNKNSWYRVESIVVDMEKAKREALKKLTKLDKLILGSY